MEFFFFLGKEKTLRRKEIGCTVIQISGGQFGNAQEKLGLLLRLSSSQPSLQRRASNNEKDSYLIQMGPLDIHNTLLSGGKKNAIKLMSGITCFYNFICL